MRANMVVIYKKLNEFLFFNTMCKLFTWLENIISILKHKFGVKLLTRTASYWPMRNTNSKHSTLFYHSMNMSTASLPWCICYF
jgi:hypothetical protein